MVIIGINGAGGAGKTTLSENLFLGTDRVVVHLDHIFDRIMELIPKSIFSSTCRDNGEKVRVISKDSSIRKIAANKYVSKVMWFYARKVIENLIKKYEKEGFEYFIIDGFYLENCVNLSDLDYSIFVNAPLELRYNRINKRNTEEEISKRGNSAIDKNNANSENYDFTLYNSGSYDDYLEIIRETEHKILSQKITRSRTIK